jgi:hypothetical protein
MSLRDYPESLNVDSSLQIGLDGRLYNDTPWVGDWRSPDGQLGQLSRLHRTNPAVEAGWFPVSDNPGVIAGGPNRNTE